MADVHTPARRSRNMSAIRGRDTKPEIKLRKILWAEGLRYRCNSRLPGKPDIVFPAARIVIFVDGCFWHRCPEHFKQPATNADFWMRKISGNVERDKKVAQRLQEQGWQVMRFWEHSVRKNAAGVAKEIPKEVTKQKYR